ncbi:MAG: hypothetical protein AB8B69_18090 [Chitinophagales bacterium]
MRNLVTNFIVLFLFSTSLAFSQTPLKGSGDIAHLKAKINSYDEAKMAAITELFPNATPKALADAMQETGFLKNGEKYVPAINEPNNGCVGGGIGRGVGYLGNMGKGIDVSDESSDPSLGQEITDEILERLKKAGLFNDNGTTGKPTQWGEIKRGVTHDKQRDIGRDIDTYVFDFPEKSGTPSSETSASYKQPKNIPDALKTIAKALKNGHVVEYRMDNGTGCGATSFHFALAYRMVEFKGFDGLYGLSFVDDGADDGESGQGNGKAENYERGVYIFDKDGKCLNAPGVKITHFFVEKFKGNSTQKRK